MSSPASGILHIIYRSVGADNQKGRPPYFSKLLCLRSLLRSVRSYGGEVRIVFINDGPVPDDRLEIMKRWGTVVSLSGIGNSASYREALKLAVTLPEHDFVYLAEDDYLYTEHAIARLIAAFSELRQVDYITLFDHLDRYTRNDDARRGQSRVYVAAEQHWRTIDSTCMTFGARVGALRRDSWVHRLFTIPNTPRDRHIWRLVQGISYFVLKFPKRLLVGPVPSLATHMDPASLAPNVNWDEIARQVAQSDG